MTVVCSVKHFVFFSFTNIRQQVSYQLLVAISSPFIWKMFCTDLQCNFFSSGRLTNYRKSWLTVNQFWIQRGRWKFKMLKDNKMSSCAELAEQVLRFRDHAYFELIIRETLAWCFIFNLRVLGSLKHQETDWKPKKFSWTDICRRKSGIIPILHKKGKWVFALILGRVTLKNHGWQKELPDWFCNSDTEYLNNHHWTGDI